MKNVRKRISLIISILAGVLYLNLNAMEQQNDKDTPASTVHVANGSSSRSSSSISPNTDSMEQVEDLIKAINAEIKQSRANNQEVDSSLIGALNILWEYLT
jgi:hypothetical protein